MTDKSPRPTPPSSSPLAHEAAPEGFPSLPFRSAALSARKPTRFNFHPDAAGRAAIADSLGLIELPGLTFVGEIRPTGRRDFTLEAQLTARAVQPCSVTLAPVPCQLEEVVRRRFDADFTAPETEEAEMVDDEVDPMPEIIDIAAIAAEALALALPLYPRAKGAELGEAVFAAPGTQPLAAADLKPFAGLAALADRLKKPDSDPSSQG